MGICGSTDAPAPVEEVPKEKKVPIWERRKNLNIEDYMFKGRSGETLVRNPGQVDGQQFVVEEVEDCDLWLLDHSATVSVDKATNSRFFIGPCASSVFIRDCTNCKFVVACQQMRLRDCKGLDILIYCKTQPILEPSDTIRVGCFDVFYDGLQQQFDAAELVPWTNPWCPWHDFNPTGGSEEQGNWTLLPEGTGYSDLLRPIPADAQCTVASLQGGERVVPLTRGRARPALWLPLCSPRADRGRGRVGVQCPCPDPNNEAVLPGRSAVPCRSARLPARPANPPHLPTRPSAGRLRKA